MSSSILKLLSADSGDAETVRAIQDDFKDFPDGKELCSPDVVHKVVRTGAYAMYLATGPNALPVVGPADSKFMDLRGSVNHSLAHSLTCLCEVAATDLIQSDGLA